MKNILTVFLLVIQISLANAQIPCLVANYELDGNATDNSGNNFNGTNHGAIATIDRYGNPNRAFSFDGVTSYIDLGSDFDYPQRTISLWFKSYSLPGSWGVIYVVDHGVLLYGLTKFLVMNKTGKHIFEGGVGNTNFYDQTIEVDNWYHAAIVVNSSYVKYYIDGVLMDSVLNNDFAHSSAGPTVARLGSGRNLTKYFYGAIDQVKIFNCALTDAQVNTLYLSVDEIENGNIEAILYPSPAQDLLTLELSDANICKDALVSIYTINGQLIYSEPLGGQKSELKIGSIAKGLYVLKVSGPKINILKKFVKE